MTAPIVKAATSLQVVSLIEPDGTLKVSLAATPILALAEDQMLVRVQATSSIPPI